MDESKKGFMKFFGFDDEEETEMIKTYMERMLQANNDIH